MRALMLIALVGCGPSTPPANPPVVFSGDPQVLTPGIVDDAPPAPTVEHVEYHCLPVVAKPCGCVYSCGLGHRDGDHWVVTHEHWKTPLTAVVDRWCVDGNCSEVFAAQIVCDGICPPKPAPPCLAIDLANEKEPCPTGK